jgi:hypothetical protein
MLSFSPRAKTLDFASFDQIRVRSHPTRAHKRLALETTSYITVYSARIFPNILNLYHVKLRTCFCYF